LAQRLTPQASNKPASGAKTIPAYLVFLVACYLLIDRVDYRLAIVDGLGAWLAAALMVFLAPRLL